MRRGRRSAGVVLAFVLCGPILLGPGASAAEPERSAARLVAELAPSPSALRLQSRSVNFAAAFPTLFASDVYVEHRSFLGAWQVTDVRVDLPLQLQVTAIDLRTTRAAANAVHAPGAVQLNELRDQPSTALQWYVERPGGSTTLVARLAVGRLSFRIQVDGPTRLRSDLVAYARATAESLTQLRPGPDLAPASSLEISKLFTRALTLLWTPYLIALLIVACRDAATRQRIRSLLGRRRDASSDFTLPGAEVVSVAGRSRNRRWRLAVSAFFSTAAQGLGALFAVMLLAVMVWSPNPLVLGLLLMIVCGLIVARHRGQRSAQAQYRRVGREGKMLANFGAVLFVVLLGSATLAISFVDFFGGTLGNRELADKLHSDCELAALMLVMAFAAINLPFRAARRGARVGLQRILEADGRPEVLLLRSFADDKLKIRARRGRNHSLVERLALRRFDRFEEVLAWNLWTIGPVVAAADPKHEVPPLGAARDFYDMATWEEAIRAHISAAALIAVNVAVTSNLDKELEAIAELGAVGRTVLVLPPVRSEREADERLAHLATIPSLGIPQLGRAQEPGVLVVLAIRLRDDGRHQWFVGRFRDDTSYALAIEFATDGLGGGDAVDRPVAPSAAAPVNPSAWRRRRRIVALSLPSLGAAFLSVGVLTDGLVEARDLSVARFARPAHYLPGHVRYPPPMTYVAADGGDVLTADPDGDVQVLTIAADGVSERETIHLSPSAVAIGGDTAVVADLTQSALGIWRVGAVADLRIVSVAPPFAVDASDDVVASVSPRDGALDVVPTHGDLRRVHLGGQPIAVALDAGRAYVVDAASDQVVVIDLASAAVVRRFDVCAGARAVVVGLDRVTVACENADVVQQFGTDGAPGPRTTVRGGPHALAAVGRRAVVLDRTGRAAFVGGGDVVVPLASGRGATGVAATGDGRYVLTTLPDDERVGIDDVTE